MPPCPAMVSVLIRIWVVGTSGNPRIEVVGVIMRIDPVVFFLESSPGLHR